jgi:hypothetical protein
VLLKRPHGVVEFAVEDVNGDVLAGAQVLVRAVGQPQRRQRCPDLGDRTPAVTVTQTRHSRPFPAVLLTIVVSGNHADEAKTG